MKCSFLVETDSDIEESEEVGPPLREPLVLEELHKYIHVVDDNNSIQQRIEEHWKSQRYDVCVFVEVFGMMLANAYLCYKYAETLYHPGHTQLTYIDFLDQLTCLLSPEADHIPNVAVTDGSLRRIHKLVNLNTAPKFASRDCLSHVRLACTICKTKCSHYCVAC